MSSKRPNLPSIHGKPQLTLKCTSPSTRPPHHDDRFCHPDSPPVDDQLALEDHMPSVDCHSPPPPCPVETTQRRPTCNRCSRPLRVCICFALPATPIPTLTKVIIVQTLAEAKAKVRTADLVPLVLQNANILPAKKGFEAHIPPDATLLFPGRESPPLDGLIAKSNTLVFIDATWDKAQRLLNKSNMLKSLSRASISHQVLGKSLFRARKPPTSIPAARSTAEAVAGALQCVDGGTNRDAVAALRRCVYEASESQMQFVRAKGQGAGKHRKQRAGYQKGWYDKHC